MKKYFPIILILALIVAAQPVMSQTAVIDPVGVTHQDIHDGLIDTTKFHSAYTGLKVVGVGSLVYLNGYEEGGEEVTAYTWSLDAPDGSSSTLDDEDPNFVAFRPDMEGTFTVNLSITTASGTADTTLDITSAKFVGVGTIAGATPDVTKGQCGLCHFQQTKSWQGTGHADFFERAIKGEASDHYNYGCVDCHTVGYNTEEPADNDGFDDIARETGWTFPEHPSPDAWTDMVDNYPELTQRANIQCENCHGPGSMHKGVPETMDASLDAETCNYCHDEEPYHTKTMQWKMSRHAVGNAYPANREGCGDCHSAYGYVNSTDEFEYIEQTNGGQSITCAVCHDPHSGENPAMVRSMDAVELGNGEMIEWGGTGKLCMDCHHGRRNAEEYATSYSSHFGPHYSNQADMLAGSNAIEYGREIVGSNHKGAAANGCVTCHMAGGVEEIGEMAGGHTFSMVFDNGTPDDPSDDIDNTTSCENCHGPMDSFDDIRAKYDHDLDGTIESYRAETEGLLHNLGELLPPLGDPHVEVAEDFTVQQLRAAFNFFYVEEDRSMGIHNPNYAIEILNASIKDLGGVTYVKEDEEETAMPVEFALNQNYPNPFNPSTTITFSVPEDVNVKLTVYNALGEAMKVLVDRNLAAGNHEVVFNASDMPSGIYYYEISAGDNYRQVKKMVLLK